MDASRYCKERGTNLSEVSRRCKVHRNTLYRWYESKEVTFKVLVAGTLCISEKHYSAEIVDRMLGFRLGYE